jgi:hypothetical protein
MTKISPAKTVILTVAASALLLGGCETLQSLNPFGGGGGGDTQKEKVDKYDDRPVYEPTGSIPPDAGNAKHTDETLQPTP